MTNAVWALALTSLVAAAFAASASAHAGPALRPALTLFDERGTVVAPALSPSEESGVAAWGSNENGAIGNGAGSKSDVPVAVGGLGEVKAVAAGYQTSYALLDNGTVMAWGNNSYGELGTGTTTATSVPTPVCAVGEQAPCAHDLGGVTAIAAAGDNHAIALLSNGTVVAWGENDGDQLGDGRTFTEQHYSDVPVAVSNLTSVTAIAAGYSYCLALLSSGGVMAWGGNNDGQLGDGKTSAEQPESDLPVAVSNLSDASAIASDGRTSLAIFTSGSGAGSVASWGSNESGDLGDGENDAQQPASVVPVQVSGLTGVSQIAAGSFAELALLENGTVVGWGADGPGVLGNGTTGVNYDAPVPAMNGVTEGASIAGGYGFSLVRLANGTALTAGSDEYGQLGDGAETSSDVPVSVSDLTGVTAIAVGSSHALAVGPPLATVSGVEPRGGPQGGGTPVRITGTNFNSASAVRFGSTDAKKFTVESPTVITAVSPAGTGTVNVSVTNPGGTSPPSSASAFTYGVSVANVEPHEGPTGGGTQVAINGIDLSGATAVDFGSTAAASFKVESSTSITAVSPAGSGTVDVTVTTPEGTSATSPADRFSYGNLPSVTAINPTSGEESGGTSVSVTGANFSGASAVKFGVNNAKSFTVLTPDAIRATSPAGKGHVDVTVTTSVGTSATSAADKFRYDGPSTCTPPASDAPAITSVQPHEGPAGGGTSVRITGARFNVDGPCEGNEAIVVYPVRKVLFGSTEALSYNEVSSSEITAVAPPGTGTVDVTVETFTTSPTNAGDEFTYKSTAAEETPQLYNNFVQMSTNQDGVVGWGPVKLTAPALETEVECLNEGFGGAWNGGSPHRGLGAVLGWGASGNAYRAGAEVNRECRFKKGGSAEVWVTDEPALPSGGGASKRGPLSVPWDVELRCGERAGEKVSVAVIGVPEGASAPAGCQPETAEAEEINKEEAGRTGCDASPVPPGCVKVNIVQPELGLETVFEGSVRTRVVNGFGNGLNPSHLKFEGATSGRLHLAGRFTTTGSMTGEIGVLGFGGRELIQAK